MALPYQVEDIEDVDENLRGLYVEVDGKHVLDVEGVKPPEEFEKVYTGLKKERDLHKATKDLLHAYGETKPEDLVTLRDQLEELQAKAAEGPDDNKLEELLAIRQKPLRRDYEKSLERLTEKDARIEALSIQILERDRRDAIREEADGRIQPQFLRDLMNRAKSDLKYDEERGEFYDEAGTNVSDWFNRQLVETPGWAQPSQGAGAHGGKGAKAGANPFDPKSGSYSLTKQMELLQSDPKRAERLKAQAGVGH
jgi:hypothetical protein